MTNYLVRIATPQGRHGRHLQTIPEELAVLQVSAGPLHHVSFIVSRDKRQTRHVSLAVSKDNKHMYDVSLKMSRDKRRIYHVSNSEQGETTHALPLLE